MSIFPPKFQAYHSQVSESRARKEPRGRDSSSGRATFFVLLFFFSPTTQELNESEKRRRRQKITTTKREHECRSLLVVSSHSFAFERSTRTRLPLSRQKKERASLCRLQKGKRVRSFSLTREKEKLTFDSHWPPPSSRRHAQRAHGRDERGTAVGKRRARRARDARGGLERAGHGASARGRNRDFERKKKEKEKCGGHERRCSFFFSSAN